jgi:hypothetical protein
MVVIIVIVGDDVTMGIVFVVMIMVIDAQLCGDTLPKQGNKCRMARDCLGTPGTANMLVQANDVIGRSHHHVQVVGNHQDTAPSMIPDFPDQGIQFSLTTYINPLHRFIENQQVRISE